MQYAIIFSVVFLSQDMINAQEDIDVGKTGWNVKRPVSGESVFARDDTPEQAVYDFAKAIDENRGELK
jgi:hypothetical protein